MVLGLLPPAVRAHLHGAGKRGDGEIRGELVPGDQSGAGERVFDLCERTGIENGGVRGDRGGGRADRRVALDVLADGIAATAAKCLPKDSKALLDLAAHAGVEMNVLAAADATNARMVAGAGAHRGGAKSHVVVEPDDASEAPARERKRAA